MGSADDDRGSTEDASVGDASAEDKLVDTRVRSVTEAARDQALVVIEPPDGWLDAHGRPGQYCALRLGDSEPAPYALATTPAERALRFLIRTAGDDAPKMQLRAGDAVQIGRPEGAGFDLDRTKGLDVVFVATGTGIAPIRAAIETVLDHRELWGSLALYYGARTRAHVAFADDLARWRAAAVRVELVLSRERKPTDPRYAQDAVLAHAPDPARTAFVVAGHDAVAEALLSFARGHGTAAGIVVGNVGG